MFRNLKIERYCVLCVQEGRLHHKAVAKVWEDYPSDLHDWLLKLTEEYDLTFPLENEPTNLVPCLLPEEQPQVLFEQHHKKTNISHM